MSWKKKEFEDLEDLLASFRLYFVIAGDSLYISLLCTLINICGIDCKKKIDFGNDEAYLVSRNITPLWHLWFKQI
jgi:hypothetical protein